MNAPGKVWLGCLLLFGCSSVPVRDAPTCGGGDDVALLSRYLHASRLVGSSWPGFQFDLLPVLLVCPRRFVLLNAPPLLGFRPLEGSRCPCGRDPGIALEPDGLGVIGWLHGEGGTVWLTSAEGEPAGDGQAVLLINGQARLRRIAGGFLAHEGFHRYQQAMGWHSRAPLPQGISSSLRREDATRQVVEQLALAEALRHAPGDRADALARWTELRRRMRSERLGRRIEWRETIEGTATYFEMQVRQGDLGGSRASMEEAFARELESGGRDLDGENWFSHVRPYVTGAALCALLDDAGVDWRGAVPEVPLAGLVLRLLSKTSPTPARPALEVAAPDLALFRRIPRQAPEEPIVRVEFPARVLEIGWAWDGLLQRWREGSTQLSWDGMAVGLSGEFLLGAGVAIVRAFGPRADEVLRRLAAEPIGPAGFESPILRLHGRRVSVTREGRDFEIELGAR